MGTIQEKGSGRIKKLFTDDIEQVELLLAHAIPEGIANIAIAVIAIICMFFADWRLALLSLGSLPLGLFAMGMMFKSGMAKMNDYYTAATKMNNTIIEYVNGMEVVKVFGRDGESYKRYETDIKSYRDFTLDWYRICWPWMALYSSIIPCVALITIPVGTLLFLFDLFIPMKSFYGQIARLTVMSACMDRIEQVFDAPELDDSETSTDADSSAPEIEYRNVTFAYDKKDVLHDFLFTADKGEMIALVGPSGGGKSTIASLLARLCDIRSGEILLRGTDIRDMPLSVLLDNISMVFQRVYLFADTVYNNIALGRPTASREEVIEAAKKARCYDFIMQLPDGFDTFIGEGGASLSGGQSQRISIARCILKDSSIVILDEETASIDADNESYIQQAISELCKGKTLIVIAHRLNTIENADKILVISGGKLAEQGTHSELMQKGGIYCGLVQRRQQAAMWKM